MQRLVLLVVATCISVNAQLTPFQAILQVYKRQGLRFKEDSVVNNGPILEAYDFIVVGSSPSGCVLANRLTENPRWKVLLIEAGIDGSVYTDVPTLSTYLLHTEYNWNFKTEKSPNACLGLVNRMCPWPAGKAVGGGSVINALIYTRGTKRDFDRWASLGNSGWSYEDVLPYFKKSEDIRIPRLRNSPYHGTESNLTVGYNPFATGSSNVFLEAGRELGFPYTDYNGAIPIGWSKIQSTIRRGRRVSAAKAFLQPIKNRPNFHISQNTRVTRVLIDPVTKRAYGVEFRKNKQLRKILARKEVILAAGSCMSPFLLMHSGVGPQEHLSQLGIPVIQDLRVGDNLQEHLTMTGLTFLTNDSSLTVDVPGDIIPRMPQLFAEWYNRGTGVLTDAGCESIAYVKTPLADSEPYPDMELLFVGISGYAADRGYNLRMGVGLSDEIYFKVYQSVEGKPGWSIWPMPSLLRSRGTIRLYNTDPLDQPKITHNFLTDPYDVAIMVEGIKWAIRISQTKAFQRIGSRLHDIPIPGCENFLFGSDSYWGCVVRHITNQMHHPCGTCKMGPASDPAAVVDPRLRVRGVGGLRVIDASIMPLMPTGHTQAPAYMIGEKGADLIKQDWGVLLIEAGIDGSVYTDVPTLSTYLLHTEYNWNFKTEKSPNACLGLVNRMCPWPAGKAVGGGSVINALLYTRGTKRDFDRWAALGNSGWSYEDVLPYFKKSEDIRIPRLRNSPYHGTEGNLTVGYNPFATGSSNVFLEAGRELGFPYTDYNGAIPIGWSKIQSTIRRGRRVSAAKAFLQPIKNRPNFHISQNTRVTRVLIDPVTKRAYGVEFRKNKQLRKILARKEVILAAGSFMSPFLLMHSGVGPQEHLSQLGIPLIQDLRVGDNLQEHLTMTGLTFLTNDSSLTVDVPGDIIPRMPQLFAEWYSRGTGVLTDAGCESIAYVKTPLADSEPYPDMELLFVGISGFAADRGYNLRMGVGLSDEIYFKVYQSVEGKPGWSIWPMPSLLRSRGTIRLYNTDPLDQPKITHNFLTDPYDVAIMVEGIKWAIRISQTKAFQRIGSRLHDIPIPGCENFVFGSDSYWGCVVRHITNQLHHPCGTCKMGPASDPAAVVDPRLRVRGVGGLRVIDASIMPLMPTGHTQAPAYMIGEKGADLIKQDWGVFE